VITISASLLNGFLSVAASEVTWLGQSFCNTPVHREHRFLAMGANELSEKIHELRIDYQTVEEEGHCVKAPGYCSENALPANPLNKHVHFHEGEHL